MIKLKENIKKLRESKRLTQGEMAKAIGVSRSSYSAYETGRCEPDMERLVMISGFHKVSIDTMLKLEIVEASKDGSLITKPILPC